MELADVTDSKSVGSNTVRVRPPPSAPKKAGLCLNRHSPAFFGAGGANSHCAGRAWMHDSACPKFRTMRNQQSKHDSTLPPRHTFSRSLSGVLFFGAGRRDGGVTIPPSWRQKSLQYKNGGRIASKCNNVKACALSSSHLPLTREASVAVRGVG